MSQPRTFLIGDLHFGHANIIKYCNRPFKTIEEMDEALIANWNTTVRTDDTVFVLGDFALCGKDRIIELGSILNGEKTLILGNHDGASVKTYYSAGFKYVSKFPIVYRGFYILSHEPMFVNSEQAYANIFAHVHDNPIYADVSSRSFCVSVERKLMNYAPIEFEEIIQYMKESEVYNVTEV